jgi:glycerate kinase
MADGGEGTLDVLAGLGGERRTTTVTGPLGAPVDAQWLLVPPGDPESPRGLGAGLVSLGLMGDGPVAVVEAARAVGRSLHPHPTGDEPLLARTSGVGELIRAASQAGAATVVVGLGGTAATDGGLGAIEAIGGVDGLDGLQVVVASDVTTLFRDAAPVFGPQKGASPEQVSVLEARLDELAERYITTFGVDVRQLPGAGAAGGLAGGLAAIGATVVAGVELVAASVGLRAAVQGADLVVTGEGRLDATSFAGKVVAGVLAAADRSVPVWCVVGEVDPAMPEQVLTPELQGRVIRVISLSGAFGRERALSRTVEAIAEAVERFVIGTLGA